MLIAARDKYESDLDVSQCLADDRNEVGSKRRITALRDESVFNDGEKIGDDRSKDEDVYVGLGDDLVDKFEKVLSIV